MNGCREDLAAAVSPAATGPAARLEALLAWLLRHDSATLALERWCRAHESASPEARIVACPVRGATAEPTAGRRARLRLGLAEPVRYRRVRLCWAGWVLSEAENWYVPGRLTRQMNLELDGTDTPFGRVVQELRFRRRLLAVEPLWRPPPAAAGTAALMPPQVLRLRALLTGADGTPISEVVETYTREALLLPESRP